MKNSAAQIFLSEQRGYVEDDALIRQCSFSCDGYVNTDKHTFGPLQLFNDETLLPGAAAELSINNDTYLVLIPVTGDLMVNGIYEHQRQVNVGQTLIARLPSEVPFTITNPFETTSINFLQIRLECEANASDYFARVFRFSHEDYQHKFADITAQKNEKIPFSIKIGQFGGREDHTISLHKKHTNCFCFVLGGAFEVENRLLHPRDGLALQNIREVEMEALSNDAVILLLEF